MNNISNNFSIKDLENLSGILAHTIRIWEKRYGILSPMRNESNVRLYDINNLQKLLNVSLLYNNGLKISKIASLSDQELIMKVKEQMNNGGRYHQPIANMKMAMLKFDQALFEHSYNQIAADNSFRSIFIDVFIPLLQNIGLEWQSDSITPAHEHFISNLITQKLQLNIEKVQQVNNREDDLVYVLFLPSNEMHELGLLYIHYELLLRGHKSVYLGRSVPRSNLKLMQSTFNAIHFISYFTVKPDPSETTQYLNDIHSNILRKDKDFLWVVDKKGSSAKNIKDRVILFDNIVGLLNKME
ncbi:MAG: MerR family transcriptional regulator [Bacteroidia bacterium]